MPISSYDLIVLGDDFAGLVAATLCARRGLRVLLLPCTAGPSSYQLGPHTLPVSPLPFVGLGSPAVRRVLDELHFQHLLRRKLVDTVPPFQFVGPDVRLDIGADEESLARELGRELPGADLAPLCERAALVARLYDPLLSQDIALPATGFWERREVARITDHLMEEAGSWFSSLSDHPVARALVSAPAILGTRLADGHHSAPALARSFDTWRRGTPRMPGDWTGLREIFLDKFASHNGELRTGAPAEITMAWSRVTGVLLEDGEELGAQHVLCALPVAEVLRLTGKKASKKLQQLSGSVVPGGYRYTLNLVVAEDAIPEGMARTVLVVADPERPLIGENAIALHVAEPDDQARVIVTVSAICPVPPSEAAIGEALDDLRVAIGEQLEQVMPFVADHVLMAHSPHEATAPLGTDAVPDLPGPLLPEPVWTCRPDPALGLAGLPYGVGIKQLSLASSQVLPGLGLEGDFTVGWCAAKLACASLGKKKDLLKEEVLAGPAGS